MNAENEPLPAVHLYNDVHFKPWLPYPSDSWDPFPRLPVELRLRIWQLFLERHHRMVCLTVDCLPGNAPSQYYLGRNHLGRIVSGREYTLRIHGKDNAATPSPLLRVNREARQVALDFYHIQFPFPRPDADKVLYLNAKYDVVHLQLSDDSMSIAVHIGELDPGTTWVDLLHDFRAYDRKDKGIAHLALHSDYLEQPTPEHATFLSWLPDLLHHAAAVSLAEILGTGRLRSVLFVVPFRDCMRGMAEMSISPEYRFHFAQTFPLRGRGAAAPLTTFDWLEKDPRKGVEHDLSQVPLRLDPRLLREDWRLLERLLGVERKVDIDAGEQYEGSDADGKFRLYICPTLDWPREPTNLSRNDPLHVADESRAELAQHLQEETKDWKESRQFISELFSMPPEEMMPRHGMVVDAETFEAMERAPSTAIGMWLFPAHAFKEPTIVRKSCFDLSGTHPGLILFNV